MKVQPVLLTPQLDKIRRQLWEKQKQRAIKAGKAIADRATALLSQTFEHWNESGENPTDTPSVRTRVSVEGDPQSGKCELTVHVMVVDSAGKPHFVWHILDQGRQAYTFPMGKTSPPISARRRRRTSANSLTADPFPGFTGEKFVIHGGRTVRAVPPNNWYKTAANQLIESAKNDPLLKSFVPEFDIEPMTKA